MMKILSFFEELYFLDCLIYLLFINKIIINYINININKYIYIY